MDKQAQSTADGGHTEKKSGAGVGSAAGGGFFATGIVWVAHGWFHAPLSVEAAAGIASGVTAFGVFVWHTGLLNVGRQLLHGDHHLIPARFSR
jgi:hypothetical protein